jgi:NAD-dependent dihydropyrimidine dehydrogenase PreA subunit
MPDVKGRKTVVTDHKKGTRELINKLGKVAEVNAERCIGCGVCNCKCPTKSLFLERLESIHEPPKTMRDWAVQFMADRQNPWVSI